MNKKLSIITVVLLLLMTFSPITQAETKNPFSDIQGNSAAEAILYLYEKGIISGYPDGTFKPNEPITRAQASAMLIKALNIELIKNPTISFKDVTKKSSYYQILATVNEKGILRGENGYMRPGETTTRAQMAAILRRSFNMTLDNQPTFVDVSPVHWAYGDVNSVAKNRVASGYPDGTFKPSDPVTRAHFSAFLARAMDDSMKVSTYKSSVGELGTSIDRNGWTYTMKKINHSHHLVKTNQKTKEEKILLSNTSFPAEEGIWRNWLGWNFPIVLYNDDIYIMYQKAVGQTSERPMQYGIFKTSLEGGEWTEISLNRFEDMQRNMYIWNDRIYYTIEPEVKDPYFLDLPNVDHSLLLYSVDLEGNDRRFEYKFNARFIFKPMYYEFEIPNSQYHQSIDYEHSTMYYFNKTGIYKYSLIDKKATKLSNVQAKDMTITPTALEVLGENGKKYSLKK